MKQLNRWKDNFGDEYTRRNVVDWRSRIPIFERILDGLEIDSVLEVGCNRGHNLLAIHDIIGDKEIYGIEPNGYARSLAQREGLDVINGDICDIPFKDGYFDLVFTYGVLIHIPENMLPRALNELYCVSRHYIVLAEYFSEKDEVIHYRGYDDMLWRRNYLEWFLSQTFPNSVTLIRSGFEKKGRITWWVFKK